MLSHKVLSEPCVRKNKNVILPTRFKDVDLTLSLTPTTTIISQVKVPRGNNTVNQFQGCQSNLKRESFPAKRRSNVMGIKCTSDTWEGLQGQLWRTLTLYTMSHKIELRSQKNL